MFEKCGAIESGKNVVVDMRHEFLGVEVTGKDGLPMRLVLFDSHPSIQDIIMAQIFGQPGDARECDDLE